MLERYAFYMVAFGALVGVVGFIWLSIRGFSQHWLWGLAVLFIPPVGLLFIFFHFRKAAGPLGLLLLAGLFAGVPYLASYYERHFVPLKPYEQIVDGELRITLTGLKDFDYATLRQKPQVAVLQMANADVDDGVLEYLKGMNQLRELDLNGTQITDQGLIVIAALPQLKTLRIARTKITDEGFHKSLFSKESLTHLDLTGTEVKGKTKRDWRKEKPEEREYVD